MVEEKEQIPIGSGLSTDMPLGSRIGRIQVAVRPPDPFLVEKITDRIKEIKKKGIHLPENSSLAIRSVDGFYYIRSMTTLDSAGESQIVSIVNYDPVRRTFILSGNGDLDDLCEFYWYAFEAFTMDLVIYHTSGSDEEFRSPDQMDDRVSFNLSKLKVWKDERILEEGSHLFWKGKGLDDLFEFLVERFG
jgi:hypothetical protein